MPRRLRLCPAGTYFHVLNRSIRRLTLFDNPGDYQAFMKLLASTHELIPLPIYAFALMPNHWHFVVRPTAGNQVSRFFHRLTYTHAVRWNAYRNATGKGHVYQARFKSFPVQDDTHLLTVIKYVEQNPLRAKLAHHPRQWPWCSAAIRSHPSPPPSPWLQVPDHPTLPRQWTTGLLRPQSPLQVHTLRHCIERGQPYGTGDWVSDTARALRLDNAIRHRGRPPAQPDPPTPPHPPDTGKGESDADR